MLESGSPVRRTSEDVGGIRVHLCLSRCMYASPIDKAKMMALSNEYSYLERGSLRELASIPSRAYTCLVICCSLSETGRINTV